MTSRSSNARGLARAFLVLLASIEVALLIVAALVDADLESPRTHLVMVATSSAITSLGLFMTWGDAGSRTRNAVRTLLVLFVLVGGVVALLLWAAATASKGS
jgi:hypothetical protein